MELIIEIWKMHQLFWRDRLHLSLSLSTFSYLLITWHRCNELVILSRTGVTYWSSVSSADYQDRSTSVGWYETLLLLPFTFYLCKRTTTAGVLNASGYVGNAKDDEIC